MLSIYGGIIVTLILTTPSIGNNVIPDIYIYIYTVYIPTTDFFSGVIYHNICYFMPMDAAYSLRFFKLATFLDRIGIVVT